MEGKKFDFADFLRQLVPKITPYTEINLIQIAQNCINFAVRWIISHKHKNYRFICSPQQLAPYVAILIPHLQLYPIRRLTINVKALHLASLFGSVMFDEVIFDKGDSKQIQEVTHFVFEKLNAKKVTFTQALPFHLAARITSLVHRQFPNSDVNMHFRVDKYHAIDAISFVREWELSLPEKPSNQVLRQKQFGYPFPVSRKQGSTKRRQQISANFEHSEVFTLRQLDNLGCEIIFRQKATEQFLREIIELLLNLKRFASLQIEQLNGAALIKLVQIVLEQFEQGYYRIIVGNQLQLTPCRLILNTTSLSKAEVATILALMQHPGHYEFICYSSAEHFPAALQLFRAKPLIKFNFFLPLQELPPLQQLLKKMERHANNLFLKAYSYAGMLKNLARLGYLAVNSIFYALGERP